jgi:hypothetical protein
MKKYFKFPVESNLGIGTQYIEFDSDGWPVRQAECYGDKWFNSKQEYHKEPGGIGLCDQPITEFSIEMDDAINSKEFEDAWNLSNEVTIPLFQKGEKTKKISRSSGG